LARLTAYAPLDEDAFRRLVASEIISLATTTGVKAVVDLQAQAAADANDDTPPPVFSRPVRRLGSLPRGCCTLS
jgi:hypothetical protein